MTAPNNSLTQHIDSMPEADGAAAAVIALAMYISAPHLTPDEIKENWLQADPELQGWVEYTASKLKKAIKKHGGGPILGEGPGGER